MNRSYLRTTGVLAAAGALALSAAAMPARATVEAHPFVNPGVAVPGAAQLWGVSAVSPDDVWAVGETRNTSSVVEHWDGDSWNSTSGVLGDVFAIDAVASDNVWAAGYDDGAAALSHWDGTSWVQSPTPHIDGQFRAVDAFATDDIWAVGNKRPGRKTATLIEHWNGRRWSVQPSDPPGVKGSRYLYSVKAISPTDAWVVGDSQQHPIVEHWDGTAWSDVKTPHLNHPYDLYGVDAAGPDDVWVVGSYFIGFPILNRTFAMHWDGSSWTVARMPPEPDEAYLNAVDAISTDNVWAVGQALIPGREEYRTLIEHWDGTSWTKVPCPNPTKTMNNVLSAVSADSANDAWTVGSTYYDRKERSLVLHWDGQHWTK